MESGDKPSPALRLTAQVTSQRLIACKAPATAYYLYRVTLSSRHQELNKSNKAWRENKLSQNLRNISWHDWRGERGRVKEVSKDQIFQMRGISISTQVTRSQCVTMLSHNSSEASCCLHNVTMSHIVESTELTWHQHCCLPILQMERQISLWSHLLTLFQWLERQNGSDHK